MEKIYSVSELAAMDVFPYKSASIRKFIKSGKLKAQRLSPKKTMIRHSDLIDFLKNLQ